MPEFTFKRLGHLGEIHLVEKGNEITLCGEKTFTWVDVAPVDDRNAQFCPTCKVSRDEMTKPEGEEKPKKERPARKTPAKKEEEAEKDPVKPKAESSDETPVEKPKEKSSETE